MWAQEGHDSGPRCQKHDKNPRRKESTPQRSNTPRTVAHCLPPRYTDTMQGKKVIVKRVHHQALFDEKRTLGWVSTIDRDTDKRLLWMSCAKGHWAALGNDSHTVGTDGSVQPSVVCATDGCTFHEMVRLEGYDPARFEDPPCPRCGQSGADPGGEYRCKICGRATAHDPEIGIIVNGITQMVPEGMVTYEDIVGLSNQPLRDGYSMTYKSKDKQGTLHKGQAVLVVHEMVFNVVMTGNS